MRRDIMQDTQARRDYIDGVWALKRTPADDDRYSRYDWYVLWHAVTMMTLTPPGATSGRNAAHSGPVFLPWHRYYLKRLEAEIAEALGKPDFALPYWNWVADGRLGETGQGNAPIWGPDALGGSGDPVSSGPFGFDTADPESPDNWRVRIELAPQGLFLVDRGLRRRIQQDGIRRLPNIGAVETTLRRMAYDSAPWSRLSSASFRNDLEGWTQAGNMHNRVHGFIGGDMGLGHSPNDPVFFLHHCNCDRIWAFWQSREGATSYAPGDGESDALFRHRLSDALLTLPGDAGPGATVAQMLEDPSASYDSFADLEALMAVPVG